MIGEWINRWLPTPASAHAAKFDSVLAATHTEGALIFLSWLVLFAIMLVKFRARPGVAPGKPAGQRWPRRRARHLLRLLHCLVAVWALGHHGGGSW